MLTHSLFSLPPGAQIPRAGQCLLSDISKRAIVMSCGVITILSLSPPSRSIFEAERHVARARCTTRTRISACNNARDRNGPAVAHQINQQRLPIGPTIYRFAAAVWDFLSGQLKIDSGVKDAFQADVARWRFRVYVKIASLRPMRTVPGMSS